MPFLHLSYSDDENHRVTLRGRQGIHNVSFFITEFIDGCSIYVEGSRTHPTVYHINAVNTRSTPPSNTRWSRLKGAVTWSTKAKREAEEAAKQEADQAARYRHMDHRFNFDKQKPKRVRNAGPGTLRPPTKLERRDYMVPRNLQLSTLQLHHKAPLFIGPHTVDVCKIEMAQSTVFGTRDPVSRYWTFYVQKRFLMSYYHVDGNGAWDPLNPLGFQWLIDSVDEFWPNPTTGRLVP